MCVSGLHLSISAARRARSKLNHRADSTFPIFMSRLDKSAEQEKLCLVQPVNKI